MTQCDHQRLQRLLDESLSEKAEREIEEHVAACASCQTELESLAADKDWWIEAGERLSRIAPSQRSDSATTGSGEMSVSHGEPKSHFAYGPASDDDVHYFAAHFAVDFLEPSDDPSMLGRLGEYEIVQVIGRGGMGIVLKGFQKELHRYVAVKVLAPHLASSGAARLRFAREAQATAAIVHPHVMAIHSVHANVKLPYLVMPFVACESLQDRLDRQGPLDVKDVLRIGIQTALGLAAAHAQGLVHRDVKPANILLETTVDRVMLTDFGLARAVDDASLTRTGIIAGTPQYMSPEQANGDAIDHRSDLFSLGSVMYAMCAGRPPFRAETTFGVLRRIREAAPRPIREINSEIPEWLDHIVIRLLSKEAIHRIDSAEKLAALLERCLAHVQQPTTTKLPDEIEQWMPLPQDDRKTQRPLSRRWRWTFGVLGSIFLLAVAVFVVRSRDVAKTLTTPSPENPGAISEFASEPQLSWDSLKTDLNDFERSIEVMEEDHKKPLDIISVDPFKPSDTLRQE